MRTRAPFVFGTQVCTSLTEGGGADREWLCSDGTGGYAMGTVAGLRTRRQHGLLVTADRKVALLTLDPVVTLTSGARVELAVHEWASGAVAPQGHQLLESFDLTDGVPRWRWRIGEVVVERELAMERGKAGVAVVHRVLAAPDPVGLTLGALVRGNCRLSGRGWQPDGVAGLGAGTGRGNVHEVPWPTGTVTARPAAVVAEGGRRRG